MNLDQQFQSTTLQSGLAFFKPDFSLDRWKDCFSWPYLGIAMDLGSDGLTGYYGLERLFELNVDQWNDQSHGTNCDCLLYTSDAADE